MSDFFRFPHTAHITWLNKGSPRDDKILNPVEVKDLLSGEVVVEEKLDGANLGISLDSHDRLRAQNRGQYLLEPYVGQFARLPPWIKQHEMNLRSALTPGLILFGEWCAAQHSLDYHTLPDWFLLFDVYDRDAEKFWSPPQRPGQSAWPEHGATTVYRRNHGQHSEGHCCAQTQPVPQGTAGRCGNPQGKRTVV